MFMQSGSTRRNFIRGAGALIALPYLESLAHAGDKTTQTPLRFLAMYHPNGVNPFDWYPAEVGSVYKMPPTLAALNDFRSEMSVFSGLSHFRMGGGGGHWGALNFLTGYGLTTSGGNYANWISLDQVLARKLGEKTRYASLSFSQYAGVGGRNDTIQTLSFDQRGEPLPALANVRQIFNLLFVQPSAEAKAQVMHLHASNRSILDSIGAEAKKMNGKLARADSQKLDQYLDSVRGVEKQIARDNDWIDVPQFAIAQDKADAFLKVNGHRHDLILELIYLALQSHSTNCITYLQMSEGGTYHGLSHWNKPGESGIKLPKLAEWDRNWVGGLARLAQKLKATREGDDTLLDRTVILYGGGHSSPHNTRNVPMLVLGGKRAGFKHGSHWSYNGYKDVLPKVATISRSEGAHETYIKTTSQAREKKTSLANLYLTIAQRLGLEIDAFADSTGTLSELTV